jgi:Ca2+-binding EF-hand superfamily protein
MLPWAFSVYGAERSGYINFEVFLTVRDSTKKKICGTQ